MISQALRSQWTTTPNSHRQLRLQFAQFLTNRAWTKIDMSVLNRKSDDFDTLSNELPGCNGIHYNVIFEYGYCHCKKIEGLYDQPAAGTRTEGRGAGPAGQPHHERAIP